MWAVFIRRAGRLLRITGETACSSLSVPSRLGRRGLAESQLPISGDANKVVFEAGELVVFCSCPSKLLFCELWDACNCSGNAVVAGGDISVVLCAG